MRYGQSRWARCESVEAAQGKEKGSKAMGTSLCVFMDSSLRNWSGHLSCSGHAPWLVTWSKQVIHGKMNALFRREDTLLLNFTDDSHQRDARHHNLLVDREPQRLRVKVVLLHYLNIQLENQTS